RAVGTRSPMLPRSAGHRYPPSFPTRRSSDLELRHELLGPGELVADHAQVRPLRRQGGPGDLDRGQHGVVHEEDEAGRADGADLGDRKSTRLNSSHVKTSYAVFCLKKKIPVGS